MNTIWSKWISYEYHMNIIQTLDEYQKTKISYGYRMTIERICSQYAYVYHIENPNIWASRAQQNTTTAQLQLQSADQASNRTNIIFILYADQMNIM